MNDKERDIIDDLFQSKLFDFEANTSPEDWNAIADRLPGGASIPFYRRTIFWTAAATIALLLAVGGLFMVDSEDIPPQIAQEIERQTDDIKTRMQEGIDTAPSEPVLAFQQTDQQIIKNRKTLPVGERDDDKDEVPEITGDDERKISEATSEVDMQRKDVASESPGKIGQQMETSLLVAEAVRPDKKEKPSRRWGFGMGAGGVSVGANSSVPDYMVSTMGLRSEEFIMLNAASDKQSLPKTDIHHKKPISFGLGVSYFLNDRWALQSGVTYSYLSSDWTTTPNSYQVKTTQKLHMVGIPLSVTYKIAEWNRFRFYASAGVLAELNVSGTQTGEMIRDVNSANVTYENTKLSVRMKEPLISVNARAGVSYPLLKFLSAYGEVGAGYHFDNGSSFMDSNSDNPIIYSDKPFNLSLQLGLRLGF
ncbi:outer membrane beta-barrel protein [Parabacteroides sp. OttesenSCG-928-K15]|nr:outer membrane beta-barrel protein [Parabacteroides sp. OttesenSCG-928-K15]